MVYASIQVEKLTPQTGVEVRGVGLARPLDERAFKEARDALIEHGVIFFRDQHLTPDQRKAFGRLFGELRLSRASPSRDHQGRRPLLPTRGAREQQAIVE
jgi:taurine dioxygenase